MRRIDILINEARDDTDNLDFGENRGVSDRLFLKWANDAQRRIYSLIRQQNAAIFEEEEEVDVVSGQEAYDIPALAFLNNAVVKVEYSQTGNSEDYEPLDKVSIRERYTGSAATPEGYIRMSGQILLQPKPSGGGKIRVTFIKRIPRLDLRRGQVGAVTLNAGTLTITALTLDTDEEIDEESLEEQDEVSVCDKFGNLKMAGIKITDVDPETGVVTIDPAFVYEAGESIAVGDYVLAGPRSTTHSQLMEECETYLVEFMKLKALKKDSSVDSAEQVEDLAALEAEILGAIGETDGDVEGVPVLDPTLTSL